MIARGCRSPRAMGGPEHGRRANPAVMALTAAGPAESLFGSMESAHEHVVTSYIGSGRDRGIDRIHCAFVVHQSRSAPGATTGCHQSDGPIGTQSFRLAAGRIRFRGEQIITSRKRETKMGASTTCGPRHGDVDRG